MSTIAKYFETLRDWKKLPAYKAETRVDSIVGFALPQVFAHARDLEVVSVIPELPLRIGSVRPQHEGKRFANRSYKVDFFVVTACGKNYLVEFKTDSRSRRENQDDYLQDAKSVGLTAIVTGILTLYSKTTYRQKYEHLLSKLKAAGLIEGSGSTLEPSVAVDDLQIIYIQPHIKVGDKGLNIVDFKTLADALETEFSGDEFMREAALAFRTWAGD